MKYSVAVVWLIYCSLSLRVNDSCGTFVRKVQSTLSRTLTKCWLSRSMTPVTRSCLEELTMTSRYLLQDCMETEMSKFLWVKMIKWSTFGDSEQLCNDKNTFARVSAFSKMINLDAQSIQDRMILSNPMHFKLLNNSIVYCLSPFICWTLIARLNYIISTTCFMYFSENNC